MARSEKRTLSIEARLKNYIKGDLNALERGIGRFALVSVRSFQNLKGALFNVKSAVAGVGLAFGAIKFAQFARETAEQAGDLQDLANATGDLVENLSELQAAFKLSGINGDAFEGTVLALAKAQPRRPAQTRSSSCSSRAKPASSPLIGTGERLATG